jgi:hypothetical protein
MPTRLLKTVTLLAFAALTTLALADPPARVGRVALAQGQVSISADSGDEASAALVNWPVTSRNLITTAADARTELRVGSTSVRLDGDSSLEVVELDDDSLRLRLHYGSASVRIVNAEVLPGFELVTPQGMVRMQQPGRLRVDAERVRDTSSVNVFDGVAVVSGGGETLTIRAGRGAELQGDDVRSGQATRDAFDDWSLARDQYGESSSATRYVTSEMTGYEDLDRYGSWRDDSQYGPLWVPSVASDWVPYRDGRWTWIEPWGWTWVDNAPWGYAPFHYGRWVHVKQRWAWTPGTHGRHPVWAPALVGWVGGNGWSATFNGRRPLPAQGWYPLSPRDRFVPGYRASDDHLRRLNQHVRPGRRHDDDHDRDRHRREGLTVVPHDQFGQRGPVVVPRAPRVAMPPPLVQNVPGVATPGVAPPAPPRPGQGWESRMRGERDPHGRDRAGHDRDRFDRRQREPGAQPPPGMSPRAPVTIVNPPPVMQAQPALAPMVPVRPDPRQPGRIITTPPGFGGQPVAPPARWQQRHEGRDAPDEGRRHRRSQEFGAGAVPIAPARPAAPPVARPTMPQPQMVAQPAPVPAPVRAAPPPAAPLAAVAPPPAPIARNPMMEQRSRAEGRHTRRDER